MPRYIDDIGSARYLTKDDATIHRRYRVSSIPYERLRSEGVKNLKLQIVVFASQTSKQANKQKNKTNEKRDKKTLIRRHEIKYYFIFSANEHA